MLYLIVYILSRNLKMLNDMTIYLLYDNVYTIRFVKYNINHEICLNKFYDGWTDDESLAKQGIGDL